MHEPNVLLRAARERTPSRIAPGECLSRAELAETVNAYLWQTTGRRYELAATMWRSGNVAWSAIPLRLIARLSGRSSASTQTPSSGCDRVAIVVPWHRWIAAIS